MSEDWSVEDGHISSDEVDASPEEDPVDHLDTYEINTGVISDTFRQLRRKAEMSAKSNRQPGEQSEGVDGSISRFLLENINVVDIRDLANLTHVSMQEMKAFLSQMGVKQPIVGAKRWKDLTFKTPESAEDCAKCAVQAKHSTFFAGIFECRQCLEENITYWIEEGAIINVKINDRVE